MPIIEEKILTKHPLGKSGKNITRKEYDTIKKGILTVLGNLELTHTELMNKLYKELKGKFSKNINWYGETVKLDLEARKIIKRTDSKPQKYKVLLYYTIFSVTTLLNAELLNRLKQ